MSYSAQTTAQDYPELSAREAAIWYINLWIAREDARRKEAARLRGKTAPSGSVADKTTRRKPVKVRGLEVER